MRTTFVNIKEIKTPVKVSAKIYLFDLAFVIIFAFIFYQLRFLVSDYLKYPYLALCIIWGIVLTMPSKYNKGKRNYQTLLYFVFRRKVTYQDISECQKKTKGENYFEEEK